MCNTCVNCKICISNKSCDHYGAAFTRSEVIEIASKHNNPKSFLKRIEEVYKVKLAFSL